MKTKFRLFKRNDQCREMDAGEPGYKERPYYFKFVFKGKRYARCLETNDATDAQRRSKLKYQEITTAIVRGEYDRLDTTKLRQDNPGTIDKLIAAYRTSPSEASAKTRTANIHALRFVVPANGAIRDITAAAARRYFENVTTKALAQPDQQKAASLRRSANSGWAKVKSMFTPKCLEYYRTKEIYHDSMEEFVRAGDLAKFSPRAIPKVSYNPPGDEIIQATLTAWASLADNNRNLFLAIGHELAFGLRISEVAQAKWKWHQVRAGYPVLDGEASVKNGTGLIQVRALDPWFSIMQGEITQRGWAGEPDDFIVQGTNTYRTDDLFRAVTEWLRGLGWETKKTNHALRAYAGCQVAMKCGIYEAQMFLRHSTVKVTEQNYSHFIKKFRPADPNTIATRWATVESKVASGKLDANLDANPNVQQAPSESIRVMNWTAAHRN